MNASDQPRYPLGYIPALDGLRAVAILLVIVVHTVPQFTGGFLGVDLFFVLSGYLITGILLREKALDRGTLLEFYRRRALRLLPALVVLCVVYLAFAFLALPDRAQALQDVGATLTSVANWTRAFNLGIPRHFGHTWSLAIEDQFYLLWPLALAGLLRVAGRRTAFNATVLMIGVCMLWRLWLTLHDATPERLYNGFDTRCDALLCGCALALSGLADPRAPSHAGARALAWLWPIAASVLVLAIAFTQWTSRSLFLGGYTAIALANTILIAAATRPTIVARMASVRPLVAVGRISYALYLWHYPIAFILQAEYRQPTLLMILLTFSLSFAAAIASYVLVERPLSRLRYGEAPSRARVLGPAAASFMVCSLLAGTGYFLLPTIIGRSQPMEIVDFGPRDVVRGQPFNQQPSGNSAVWIRANRSVPAGTRIKFGEALLNTVLNDAVLTAEVPDALLAQPGPVPILLLNSNGARVGGPVEMVVRDAAR
jgi:peptidoglycan/LPS O-acetylase OafA/YrhL